MTDERSSAGCSTRVSCESLVKPDRESRFLLPVREMRNWNPKTIIFSITIIPIAILIPPDYPQGAGTAILRNQDRATSTHEVAGDEAT